MADFNHAFDKTVRRWESFQITDTTGDYGRQTYAGISRHFWPGWAGWGLVDAGKPVPESLVIEFYRVNFWDAIEGDDMRHQDVAEIIFDWSVNAGLQAATRMTMNVLGLPADTGISAALQALNALNSPRLFVCEFALRRVAHRARIIRNDPTQAKFIRGWLNRDLAFALGNE